MKNPKISGCRVCAKVLVIIGDDFVHVCAGDYNTHQIMVEIKDMVETDFGFESYLVEPSDVLETYEKISSLVKE